MRREKLQENFEDALFALLMYEVAEQEGQRLLEENERLKLDPESAVPLEIDRRCMKKINREFAKTQRREARHTAYLVFRQVAMVVVIGMLLFVTAFATFPEVRVKTLNLVIEASDVATCLTLRENDITSDTGSMATGSILQGYRIPAVSEEFVIENYCEGESSSYLRYCNMEGATIRFHIITAEGATHYVETEGAEVTPVLIHGYEGLVIEEGNRITITWGDTDRATFVSVICDKISKEAAMSLADEVVYAGAS